MRRAHLRNIQEDEYDLVVIGGGASGAGAALDAAQRGLKVILIEQGDWGGGTSSRSTKLLHGGVRYLEMALKNLDFKQLRQVKHGLSERKTMLEAAPHLAHGIPLVTPVFSWFEALYLTVGLKLYGLIAGKRQTLPGSSWISKREALRHIPMLRPEVHSAVMYHDGQFDDARYTILQVRKAQQFYTICLNYVAFFAFGKSPDGAITHVHVTDRIYGMKAIIQTKSVLNCTGAYADHVRLAANASLTPRITASKGVHITLPLPDGMKTALMIPKTSDGRLLFAIPFQGVLLLGTTDTPYEKLEFQPEITDAEVKFLLDGLNQFLGKKYTKKDVLAGFAGLRPLISEPGRGSTKQLLRDHEVETDPQSGLVSLMGGKWTTHRLMAKDAVDEICRRLDKKELVCKTETVVLPGGESWLPDGWKTLHKQNANVLSKETAIHLHQRYGSWAYKIAEICKENKAWVEPLCEGVDAIGAEVIYHARYEMATNVQDVLSRRLRIENNNFTLAYRATHAVARLLGQAFHWPDGKEEEEAVAYYEYLYERAKKTGIRINEV
jgi:glycerol-3-phosphate dehydrogenase